jgi:exonuclease VII large subunit
MAIKDLQAYSPHTPLKRGFALVTKDCNIVKNISGIKENDELCVEFIDGNIDVVVKHVRRSKIQRSNA